MGPRSFSRCRKSASRSVSPYMTRPETSVRVIEPDVLTRSSTPTSVTCPMPSTRTGTASTYSSGSRRRICSSSSSDSQPGLGSGVRVLAMPHSYPRRARSPVVLTRGMTGMQLIDDSAIMWSAPEHERAERPLLVLMHGYGSHEGDLFGLSQYLPLQPVIASLRGPIRSGLGYAWYDIADDRGPQADAAARGILHWLDRQPATSVGLLGFSQGGSMAIQLLRHAPERFDFAVSLAGFVVPGPAPADDRMLDQRP